MSHLMELEVLAAMLAESFSGIPDDPLALPPVFSFEGLPGAGKSTQIARVARRLKEREMKVCAIDLPADTGVAKVLRALYSDQTRWQEVRVAAPWLNPLFLAIDLRLMLIRAAREGVRCALMSRGLVSTYYYNLDAFVSAGCGRTEAWEQLTRILRAFTKPVAIVFLDLPIDSASRRVLMRNRPPLRSMDSREQMTHDLDTLNDYVSRLSADIVVHRVNGDRPESEVTEEICSFVEATLEAPRCVAAPPRQNS